MRTIIDRLLNEPVMVVSALQAALVVAVAFSVDISGAQQDALLGFVPVALALAAVVRGRVTPTRKL